MSEQGNSNAAYDFSVEPVLGVSRREAADRRAPLRRRRNETVWTGWLTSVVLHGVLVLVLSILWMPIDLGEFGALKLDASLEPDERPLETFTMLADDEWVEPIELVAVPDPPLSEIADVPLPEVSYLFAVGASGRGSRGWRDASAGRRGGSGGRSGGSAEFFGTVAYGDRFVYVLDVSSSMNRGRSGKRREGNRFERASEELLRSLDQLREDQSFYVILFSKRTVRMFDSESIVPKMLPGTPENKRKLRYWLEGIELGGMTDPREALWLGFELKPSAIFLLSDGEFNGQKNRNRSSVFTGNPSVFEIVEGSSPGYIPVHTIAYEDPASRQNMEELSARTGGVYRYVPALPATTNAKRAASNSPQTKPHDATRPSRPRRTARRRLSP